MRKLWVPSRDVIMPRPWYGQRGFFVPPAPFASRKVAAADADQSSATYFARGGGMTGAADSKQGVMSMWVRIDAAPVGGTGRLLGASSTLGGTGDRTRAFWVNGGPFRMNMHDASGTSAGVIETTTNYSAGATWYHVIFAWDGAASAAAVYVNDADDTGTGTVNNVDQDFTVGDWGAYSNPDGTNRFNGCLAEVWFHPGVYMDLSVAANRRKFIRSDGKPEYLGRDGSRPFGVRPLIYLRLRKNEAVANFAVNRGTGGNFSVTGTPTIASSSPSD